jgi:hypothetical protein
LVEFCQVVEGGGYLGRHCQRKAHYSARSLASNFGVIDLLRLFRIESIDSTAT